jgi:hypothetical protein
MSPLNLFFITFYTMNGQVQAIVESRFPSQRAMYTQQFYPRTQFPAFIYLFMVLCQIMGTWLSPVRLPDCQHVQKYFGLWVDQKQGVARI